MTSFGSSPSPQPTPSFWNEPTTNALAGTSSAVARRVRLVGVHEREVLEVDPDRDDVHCARLDARLENEVAHLSMRDLDPREALRRRAKRVTNAASNSG